MRGLSLFKNMTYDERFLTLVEEIWEKIPFFNKLSDDTKAIISYLLFCFILVMLVFQFV